MNVGLISHTLAAAGFFVLFLMLLMGWRRQLNGGLLILAVFVTLLWALASVFYAKIGVQNVGFSYRALGVARNLTWVAFLLQLFRPLSVGKSTITRLLRVLYPGIILFAVLTLVGYLFPQYYGVTGLSANMAVYLNAGLALCGLLLLGRLFHDTKPEKRWAIKHLYIGLGALFAYDLALYASIMIFNGLDTYLWDVRGMVNVMVVPFIATAAAHNPEWSLDIFISRRMVVGIASFFGIAIYMLSMVAIGHYIGFYGGIWGTAMQLTVICGGALLLMITLLSKRLQAQIKVFFNKHFFRYKYNYREEWLKFIGILSAGQSSEPLRERAIHALADILNSPGGMLWTQRECGNFFLTGVWKVKDQDGPPPYEVGSSSFIKFLECRQWVIDLDECATRAELYEGLSLPLWLRKMREAWLVVPLVVNTDKLLGFVVLARPIAKTEINWEDHDLLKTAGRQVASYIALIDTTEALVEARQFEAFNRLSVSIVHDLKNISSQLGLVVANAARHRDNPAFVDDILVTVESSVSKVNRILAQFRKDGSIINQSNLINLNRVLRQVIRSRRVCRPRPVLVENDSALILRGNRGRLTSVVEHLIQNAQEATALDGRVEVKVYREHQLAVIEISDDGCGMDAEFIRERLFRPFDTTKGNIGMGIGVYESREFVHKLGGDIDVVSQPGAGTTFFIRLPAIEEDVIC